jgi:hypothetical protein
VEGGGRHMWLSGWETWKAIGQEAVGRWRSGPVEHRSSTATQGEPTPCYWRSRRGTHMCMYRHEGYGYDRGWHESSPLRLFPRPLKLSGCADE